MNITFNVKGVDETIVRLEEYKNRTKEKCQLLAKRLADMGAEKVEIGFASALYDGIKDNQISVNQVSESQFTIIASGKTVAFLEFGAGVYYPDNHPQASAFGVVHGTYGKGLGSNPYWFYTGQPGTAGGELAYGHSNTTITHGNPANMPMYNTAQDLKQEIARVAREVFSA